MKSMYTEALLLCVLLTLDTTRYRGSRAARSCTVPGVENHPDR